MAKLKLKDVLETMTAQTKEDGSIITNRYNKKNFEKVLTAMTSDPEFTFQVNKISKGELQSVEDIAVGHNFRNWCKKLVEAAGVDSNRIQRGLQCSVYGYLGRLHCCSSAHLYGCWK